VSVLYLNLPSIINNNSKKYDVNEEQLTSETVANLVPFEIVNKSSFEVEVFTISTCSCCLRLKLQTLQQEYQSNQTQLGRSNTFIIYIYYNYSHKTLY